MEAALAVPILMFVILDATDPDHAATIESCRLAEAGGGIAGTCNTYGSGTQFADIVAGTITQADFDDGGNVTGTSYTCDTSNIDANWCAPSRLVNRKFLGQFGGTDSVSLTINNLAAHTTICVSFDLYLIGSWDFGNEWGPDTFGVQIDGTTQYEEGFNQSSGATGETESDTLGYRSGTWGDSVVPVTVCDSSHSASSATFNFFGNLTESLGNESWGIDNVVVTAV